MKNSLSAGEVQLVLRKGKRVAVSGIMIVYMEKGIGSGEEGAETSSRRYAIIIRKKKFKKSTMRNKIRRIIREVLRKIHLPYPVFVVVYTGGVSHKYKDIEQLISKASHTMHQHT